MSRLSAREREDDSFKSWAFGIGSVKEGLVRLHKVQPEIGNKTEQAWWDEGFTSWRDIALRRRVETVRGQKT